jgi:hypothetical protein
VSFAAALGLQTCRLVPRRTLGLQTLVPDSLLADLHTLSRIHYTIGTLACSDVYLL